VTKTVRIFQRWEVSNTKKRKGKLKKW
jgi:hypothetical protein